MARIKSHVGRSSSQGRTTPICITGKRSLMSLLPRSRNKQLYYRRLYGRSQLDPASATTANEPSRVSSCHQAVMSPDGDAIPEQRHQSPSASTNAEGGHAAVSDGKAPASPSLVPAGTGGDDNTHDGHGAPEESDERKRLTRMIILVVLNMFVLVFTLCNSLIAHQTLSSAGLHKLLLLQADALHSDALDADSLDVYATSQHVLLFLNHLNSYLEVISMGSPNRPSSDSG